MYWEPHEGECFELSLATMAWTEGSRVICHWRDIIRWEGSQACLHVQPIVPTDSCTQLPVAGQYLHNQCSQIVSKWLLLNCILKVTHTRLIHKVHFSGAVYRNKTQFHGNIYCNRYSKCSAIFQHIRHRN
jgi:hypothetical protein